MKFHPVFNRKRYIIFGIEALAGILMAIFSKYPVAILPGFLVLIALLDFVKLEPSSKGLWPWIWTGLLYWAGPFFSTFCIQYVILEPELYAKTKPRIFKFNVMCVAVIYLLFLAVLASARYAWILAHMLCVLMAFADYFVYEFRQNEITFADIATVGTGLSVAKNYNFAIHDRGAIVIMMTICAVTLVLNFKILLNRRIIHHIAIRVIALGAAWYFVQYINDHAMGLATQTWEKKGTYKNGFVLNFILGIQDGMVKAPEGYSPDIISELEKEYGYTGTDDTSSAGDASSRKNTSSSISADGQEKAPTIITIMNESFADFSLIGDLDTNIEVTPFINSLKENTLRGYALASVFGAKTPNSEWEYMTGNSMAFLPTGSVVYQQFIDDEPTSMVSYLEGMGYTTVAMHPYYASGWSRNIVYPDLGFDEMMFMDTGDFDETDLMRNYITDKQLYDKIIDRFEQKGEDEDLFIMSITMQNHGGYKDTYENFTNDVMYRNGEYADADQYLSLIHQTDIATEELIHYFENVDEPVVIAFFGDHLPSLSASFYKSLNGKGVSGLTLSQLENLFSVPFFIWTNYETEEGTIPRTSLNYLSTLVLERAGIELSPYQEFLSDLMDVVPAINSRGYYSAAKRKYYHVDAAEGVDAEWIKKYEMLQYNGMFDGKNRSSFFFPRAAGE